MLSRKISEFISKRELLMSIFFLLEILHFFFSGVYFYKYILTFSIYAIIMSVIYLLLGLIIAIILGDAMGIRGVKE